ncbi:hypothetical protein AB0M79_03840 [Polymorphospora sp. NPDC051019]|uniref:hypothetical protein n=1 Tax=Polymorphospora sp. NPDC051019 TaxID=3155725 RepID=UPI00343DB0DA
MQPKQPALDKRIVTDDDEMFKGLTDRVLLAEQTKMKTPKVLKARLADDHKRFGLRDVRVNGEGRKFDDWARVEVLDAVVNAKTLTVRFEVWCNPKHMCAPHDLVPVYLESATNQYVFMVALLEPTVDENVHTVEFTYPVTDLARALGVEVGPKTLESLKRDYPELGITAHWLADTKGQGNDPNHASGGVLEKGGSGKIILRERTTDDLKASESVRNSEWNMAERLSKGRRRPVYDAFAGILADGREMATTLEAESEYQVDDQETITAIVEGLDGLADRVKTAAELIEESRTAPKKDVEVPKRPYQLVSVEKSVKTYTDHYFDLVGGDTAYPLLANNIVLRRRMVGSDPVGTYLVSVKGRTVDKGGERIRLAAQINLIESAMKTEEGMAALGRLLCDGENIDNAFARVLHDVLAARGLTALLKQEWKVRHVLTVVSRRWKYGMKFDDATVIDFSADVATGTLPGEEAEAVVYSFEFGVGHPGLTAGGTPTALSMAKRIGQWDARDGIAPAPDGAKKFTASARPITRPYHVPADLDSPRLFQKADFTRYKTLRDALIAEVFKLDQGKLAVGGNKASVLARELKLI